MNSIPLFAPACAGTRRCSIWASLKVILSSILLLGLASGSALAQTINLGQWWKFQEDPNDTGVTNGWHSSNFDDGAWANMESKKTLESQGISFASKAGYVWFRQKIDIPAAAPGTTIQLNLASFPDHGDDVWINGVRVGGVKGYEKFRNLWDRKYTISSAIVYGGTNTIAIRLWANNHGFGPGRNGLFSGTYTMVLDRYRVMARDAGGTIASERPLGLGSPAQVYDLSACQKGTPFEMVFRFPTSDLTGGSQPANLTYTLKDFLGTTIQTGTVPVSIGADSIVRGVASIGSASSQKIYFAGRLSVDLALKDAASGATLSSKTVTLDRLSFYNRDNLQLPALPTTYESTPYGSLKLIDSIDCSTSLDTEVHPYLQGGFYDDDRVKWRTPAVPESFSGRGGKAIISLNTIAGKVAREPNWGFFSYRIGRGGLTPGKCYLVRLEYPEDKPRYCAVGVQAGDNYYDVGWKNGVATNDPYDPWPLSNTPSVWKHYDMIVPMCDKTQGTGGGADADSQNGIWVYCASSNRCGGGGAPGYQRYYTGSVAIATIKLYEIDPVGNAPAITLPPAGLPQRTLMVDWEHQAEMVPGDVVNYAKLMGYSAVAPITGIKWAKINYGGVMNGFESWNIDEQGNMVANPATAPAGPALAGKSTVHERFLAATKGSGVNYIPRFEYGGSGTLLESSNAARAYNNTGALALAPEDRTNYRQCANLLVEATYQDLKAYLDKFILPYASSNPQMIGALWRIRCEKMPVSYGQADVNLFCAETNTVAPSGYSAVQLARWASNTSPEGNATVAASYATWWHGKRRDFHVRVKNLLRSYRSDLTLYYYNWDQDNFSLMGPDINAWDFTDAWHGSGDEAGVWAGDRNARSSQTAAQFTSILTNGNFAANGPSSWSQIVRPDYALRPSLYTGADAAGIQLFAPLPQYACYANKADYVNYFQTREGLAASTCITYDESYCRGEINARHESNSILPGGAPFSMAVELLAYFNGDARTLTQTSYTYGRGFADAHRRFAQAFRALPAIPGTVVAGADSDVKVRTYTASNGTYVGVAHKGMAGKTLTITVPGMAGKAITNLVTGAAVAASDSGSDRVFSLASGPMELNAFLVDSRPLITSATTASATAGAAFSYQIIATNSPASYSATGLPSGLTINTSTGLISGTAAAGTYAITINATNSAGTGTTTLTLTVSGGAAATLTHRYTFDGNFSDSVGTAHGTLHGSAIISGGSLQQLGYSNGVSSYGLLPNTVISGLTSASFEGWFTVNADTFFNPVFSAGTSDQANYLQFVPNGGGSISQSEFRANGGTGLKILSGNLAVGTKHYFAVVYNSVTNQHILYIGRGGAALQTYTGTLNNHNLSQVTIQSFYLGRWFNAAFGLNGSVDEFRIYNGSLTSSQVSANYAAGPTPNGPAVIHRYTFNSGTVNDSAGSSHGSLVGNATISIGALQLPGYVNSVSSYASLPTTALSGLTSTTFEGWFTLQSNPFFNPVFYAGSTDGTSFAQFIPNGGGDKPKGEVLANGGTTSTVIGQGLSTGVKYYMAVVYDAANNQQTIYLGGGGAITQVASGTMNNQNLSQITMQRFYLGAWRSTSWAMHGSIDEFRVYDKAMTAAQVAASCSAGPTP